ncbi:hypothetical protein PFHG_05051 [Plasmodium falciparum HB3]|uniref:Rifin n=1 Tax=Plasmodium falciparum (isolate HB3) TaxID=137071 RepID=A0A0L7KLT1_PLAFX|nr:hypothetical protein PFHG_05051 [Plasmodium falciparum HB3]
MLLNVNTHKKPSITPRHIQTNRLLCECQLYAPQNYDNDPEMKSVMQQFHDRTTQRLQEYDEKLHEKRQVCKDNCDKEIQKIILKDKIEKELTEKLAALEADIDVNDIPTCVCEKSLADKTENFCHNCGYGLGSVAASVGIIGPIAVKGLENAALVAAAQKGIQEGIAKAIEVVISKYGVNKLYGVALEKSITSNNFKNVMFYIQAIQHRYNNIVCGEESIGDSGVLCFYKTTLVDDVKVTKALAASAQKVVADATEKATLVTKAEVSAAEATSVNLYYAIAYSVIAILIIILVMVIIYLILRYRRKKKMKKKHLYIKLLKE